VDLYHEDGRLYPNVKFFSQITGRSAYADPVLQNIGKSLDLPEMEGTSFRDCILAPEGSSMVKADYSAQELRILAHVAGDENLLNAFVAQAAGSIRIHTLSSARRSRARSLRRVRQRAAPTGRPGSGANASCTRTPRRASRTSRPRRRSGLSRAPA
jgi:DNA polymerase I-like protein with 3'-5' exonuclease and polymerase domains